MPELPEVETVRRGLEPVMAGAVFSNVLLRRANLRYPFPENFVKRLEGRKIMSVGRRAKYLTLDLDSEELLIMHLGMSGSFRTEHMEGANIPGSFYHPRTTEQKHDHVVFEISIGDRKSVVTYNDPRRFGFMDLVNMGDKDTCSHFVNMGIEPTGNSLNGEMLSRLFAGKATPLKAALLDQRLIAGLGNIYVCEALWRTGLSPKRKAGTIARKDGKETKRTELLASNIRQVISEAIEAGGSSLRDHKNTDGSLGYFQHRFNVYDRENNPCNTDGCDGTVKRIVQSGRSTFYCPTCQR